MAQRSGTHSNDGGLMERAAYLIGVAVGSAAELIRVPYRLLSDVAAPARGSETAGARDGDRRGDRMSAERRRSAPRELSYTPAVDRDLPSAALNERASRVAADEGQPALASALSDPDPAVRRLAMRTVGELSDERATRVLTEVLHDPDPSVRSAAAAAAARSRASGVVFSLILALDDPDSDVRAASLLAIEEITGEAIEAGAVEDATRRRELIEGLKQWWKERRFAELATQTETEVAR
jgi:HEAT repeat protein